jgi:hypothetical protein
MVTDPVASSLSSGLMSLPRTLTRDTPRSGKSMAVRVAPDASRTRWAEAADAVPG